MNTRLRTDASPPRDHLVRFYEDDTFLSEVVGRFLYEGHEHGSSSVVIASADHRAGIEGVLASRGVDVPQAKRSRRLLFLDAEETLQSIMVGGLEQGVIDQDAFNKLVGGTLQRASAAAPARDVRAYGEMVDFLLRLGNEATMVHLEELWNELRRSLTFQLYCGYRLSHLDSVQDRARFEKICALHSHVLPAESYLEDAGVEERRRMIAGLQQRARALEREVAERERLERVLREEQARLREANRRKDEFLAMLGHELRNPLNPILTSLDLMDLRADPSCRRERDIIRRQAMHLAGLVEDLLDISRVTGGKVVLRREPMEISTVISRAIEMASPLLEQRAHLLQIAIPARGLLVAGDPIRLPQIFANLLMNAAKYTERGGRIFLSAARDGGEIAVSCSDNGIGLPPDLLAVIFEPFVQGTRTLDRGEGGLGLGLALVRSLTQLHGGTVSAQSEGFGKGSTFTIRLPALVEEARVKSTADSRVEPGQKRNGSAERVLIVDDNADCALGFAEVVRLLGHEAQVAFDGPRALVTASTFLPTIALVDIGLPVMDGYEVARRLRKTIEGPLKLIAVTGYGEDQNRAMSLAAGFDLHAVKPVELDDLRALLSRA